MATSVFFIPAKASVWDSSKLVLTTQLINCHWGSDHVFYGKIKESDGNFCVLGVEDVYAWSKYTGTWHALP